MTHGRRKGGLGCRSVCVAKGQRRWIASKTALLWTELKALERSTVRRATPWVLSRFARMVLAEWRMASAHV